MRVTFYESGGSHSISTKTTFECTGNIIFIMHSEFEIMGKKKKQVLPL